jgi:hypothetical protein
MYAALTRVRQYYDFCVWYLMREISTQPLGALVFSIRTSNSATKPSTLTPSFQLQESSDADVLEEDDEYLFHPVQIKDKQGQPQQAFICTKE